MGTPGSFFFRHFREAPEESGTGIIKPRETLLYLVRLGIDIVSIFHGSYPLGEEKFIFFQGNKKTGNTTTDRQTPQVAWVFCFWPLARRGFAIFCHPLKPSFRVFLYCVGVTNLTTPSLPGVDLGIFFFLAVFKIIVPLSLSFETGICAAP